MPKKKEIDKMFNDMMAIGKAVDEGAVLIDGFEIFEKMSEEALQITFKHAVDVGKLEREGKSEEEIQAIIAESKLAYEKEMKEKGLLTPKEKGLIE